MQINAISYLNGVNTNITAPKYPKFAEANNTATNSITQNNDNGAYKNYILGSMAAFKGYPCKTSGFLVKTLKDVPCCCCGFPMLRSQDLNMVNKLVRSVNGKELQDTLNGLSKYLRADERALGSILGEKAAKMNTNIDTAWQNMNFGEVVNGTTRYANDILNTMSAMSQKTFGFKENPVERVIMNARKEIMTTSNLDRTKFVENLAKASSALKVEDYTALEDKAMTLPETFGDVTEIFNKYRNKKPEEKVRRLFSTAETTAEHIHPHSLGGPDNTANYIGECAGCNNPRGSKSYLEWLKVHPEYPRNAQKHIEHIEERIINGELDSRYYDYPVDMRKALAKESKGRMKLVVLEPEQIKSLIQNKRAGKKVDVHAETLKAAFKNLLDNKEELKMAA